MSTPYAESRARFIHETRDHEMTVLRDDGLYRHLRFQAPGSSFYWFDLITWPGVLTISGDCGCWVFSRTRDMFEFFEPSGARGGFEDVRWGINPDYWAQKLTAADARSGYGRGDGRSYSREAFERRLRAWARDSTDEWAQHDDVYPSLLIGAIEREVFGYARAWAEHGDYDTEEQARNVLASLAEHDVMSWDSVSEMDLREWDWSFLWCCWAIVWGIEQYQAIAPITEAVAA